MTPFIPLGPDYLTASLREAEFDPQIVDLTFFDKRKVNVEQVRDAILNQKPEAVGLSTLTWTINQVNDITNALKAEARTLDILQEMDAPFTFSICTPYPGAPLWKEVEDELRDVPWDRYDETDATDSLYLPEEMTQEHLKDCVDRANEYLLKPRM